MNRSAPPMTAAAPASTASRRPWRSRWRLGLTAASALAFAIALLRPGIHWPIQTGSTVLVIDITQSMNVNDMHWEGHQVTRLDYTRALLRRTLRELPCGHQIGLGLFTERKTMVLVAPLEVCAHYAALDDVLGAIDWRMAWAADSHVFYGVYSALDEIGSHWPGASLAFFTDGHQAPPFHAGYAPRFESRDTTPRGILFGIGGVEPQPVPHLDAEGRTTGYWTAEEALSYPPSGPRPTLSVADMEKARAEGQNARNYASRRPPGSENDHLSGRRDAVLEQVAELTDLDAVPRPPDATAVIDALGRLPGNHAARRRLDLHDGFVGLGALALLASLLPASLPAPFRRRQPSPVRRHSTPSPSIPGSPST